MSTDTGRVPYAGFANVKAGRGRSESVARANAADARRRVLRGFPVLTPLTRDEAVAYLAEPALTCLLCGKLFALLGQHLRTHGVSADEYKTRYRLPFSVGLSGSVLRDRIAAARRADPAAMLRMRERSRKQGAPGKRRSSYLQAHAAQLAAGQTLPAHEAATGTCLGCGATWTTPGHRSASVHAKQRRYCSKACVLRAMQAANAA